MKEKIYRENTGGVDRRTFGGIICASDFNTNCRSGSNACGSGIARRIARDLAFDRECMANAARRKIQ